MKTLLAIALLALAACTPTETSHKMENGKMCMHHSAEECPMMNGKKDGEECCCKHKKNADMKKEPKISKPAHH